MTGAVEQSWLFGRLGLDSLPFVQAFRHPGVSELIAAGAASAVVLGAMIAVVLLTRYRAWRPLWSDWLTSVDHKRIGIMYIVLSFVMLARGVVEGVLMRMQQADGLGGGFLAPDHFAELFSTHGTIMIFFVAMPFIAGFINYVMPLQIGARDVKFPVLNQISLALTAAGAALVMISLVAGRFSFGGWSAYPPYTEATFQPGPGPDYWIWSVTFAGIGSTLTGINFAVTIYKERAPGMNYFRMPLFTWTAFCTAIIMIFAMPPLTVATLMLALDRYLGFHFFTNDLGGNMMNYANLFWLFGHPEVYLLILPAFGIYSEVIATFSGKRLFGYMSLVIATMAISVLSFTVWLHHFFTMGQGANVNVAFGIATMFIAVPTGVKVYDWMLTMYRGRIRMTVPMIYASGFLVLFVIGGLTGVILANPTIDYQVHNTLFLVAHFHNVLVPGVLFAMLAGWHYWFPKMFGFRLDETWGRISALLWIPGFALTFFPLYVLGLMGMPRRSVSFDNPAMEPYMIVAAAGAAIILCARRRIGHPVRRQHAKSRQQQGDGRRSLERTHARVVNVRATARIQFRGRCRRWAKGTASPMRRRPAGLTVRSPVSAISNCRETPGLARSSARRPCFSVSDWCFTSGGFQVSRLWRSSSRRLSPVSTCEARGWSRLKMSNATIWPGSQPFARRAR